jgi:hypothetical protein
MKLGVLATFIGVGRPGKGGVLRLRVRW